MRVLLWHRLPMRRDMDNLIKALIPQEYRLKIVQTCPSLYFAIRLLLCLGNRYLCPCCGWKFRKFLPNGANQRPNALCPRCGSLERHRLLYLYLKNRTNLFSDRLRVLHFAPEPVFRKILMSLSNLDYISADLDSPAAMVKLDITNIPSADDSFDVILCSHSLELYQST